MKKKILFLIPNLKHGGAEKVLVNLVNNLDREKYDITVQTLFDVGVHRAALAPHVRYLPGIKQQIRGNTHIFKLFSPRILYRYFIRETYDVVVSYLEGVTARIVSGGMDPNVKKVCWIHTELMTQQVASRGFRSIAEARSCYGRFDQIVAVSQRVRQQFLALIHTDAPVTVCYNTNETEKILELASEELEAPEMKTEGLRVCAIGRVNAVKGFDRLFNVHRRLLDEGYLHRIYILGTGEDQLKLTQMARQHGAEDSFHMLGFCENPYQYLSHCDLFVCSSRREGFSTAVTEALIVGTPVVSTDCSGAKELLGEHNEYGIVVENSEDGIYEGMKKMLSEPETLAHYREMAAERGNYFSKEKTVQAVEAMLDGL